MNQNFSRAVGIQDHMFFFCLVALHLKKKKEQMVKKKMDVEISSG